MRREHRARVAIGRLMTQAPSATVGRVLVVCAVCHAAIALASCAREPSTARVFGAITLTCACAGALLVWIAWASTAWLRRVVLDERGLWRAEDDLVRWDDVRRVCLLQRADQGPFLVALEGPRLLELPLSLLKEREEILRFIKRHAGATYDLSEIEEQLALAGHIQRSKWLDPITTLPAASADPSYREPAAVRQPAQIRPSRVLLSPVGLGVGAALAAVVVATAVLVVYQQSLVAFLVAHGLGTFVAIAVVALVQSTFDARAYARYLGRDILCTESGAVSLDGERRLRCGAADAHDPYVGFHRHFEELDPARGTTLESYVFDVTWTYRRELRPCSVRVARVRPVAWSPRMYRGLPWWRRENLEALPMPAVLLLEELPDGVLLTRFAADRRYAGDTMHASIADAERQIEDELGVSAEWSEVERASAWSFWPAEV